MPKITGGSLRGVMLKAPVQAGVRPTSSRVRESLFSILGQDLSGKTFLDAFSGSGCVALEAYSRGAVVTAVEINRRAMSAIRENGQQVQADISLVPRDVIKVASQLGQFDIVFVDPPYADDVAPILEVLSPLVQTVLIIEAARDTILPDACGALVLGKTYKYGSTKLGRYDLRLRQ